MIAIAALLLIGIVYVAGCGSSGANTTGSSSSGITEAELGAPIYPGATKVDMQAMRQQGGANGSMPRAPGGQMNGSAPQFQGSRPDWGSQGSAPRARAGGMTLLWTSDAPAKVTAWYKAKLSSKPGFSEGTAPTRFRSEGGGETTSYSFKSGGETKTVIISSDLRGQGGTSIMVGDFQQGFPGSPPADGSDSGTQTQVQ